MFITWILLYLQQLVYVLYKATTWKSSICKIGKNEMVYQQKEYNKTLHGKPPLSWATRNTSKSHTQSMDPPPLALLPRTPTFSKPTLMVLVLISTTLRNSFYVQCSTGSNMYRFDSFIAQTSGALIVYEIVATVSSSLILGVKLLRSVVFYSVLNS